MTDRSFDRIADAFMAEGPVVLPDRVLDAAFEEVHRTRQRRRLRLVPWRFPTMNTYAKFAVAAVAVIAVGVLGLSFLRPSGNGVGGPPAASPSPSVTATPSAPPSPSPSEAPSAPPLTSRFTSDRHGYEISYPAGWNSRQATAPWTANIIDYFNPGSDVLAHAEGEMPFLALASQPLGDRTLEGFAADYWQIMLEDGQASARCPAEAEPITVAGLTGVYACDVALVTEGDRGYVIALWTSDGAPYDKAWFASVLASMALHPETADDEAAAPAPS